MDHPWKKKKQNQPMGDFPPQMSIPPVPWVGEFFWTTFKSPFYGLRSQICDVNYAQFFYGFFWGNKNKKRFSSLEVGSFLNFLTFFRWSRLTHHNHPHLARYLVSVSLFTNTSANP